MVRKIMRDPLFLAQKSIDATEADKQVVTDLLDTLKAKFQFAMVNPVITKKTGAFQTEEGCLSLEGVRPCIRYQEIEVDYLDQNFKKQHGKYFGWTAQIIQHDECDIIGTS
jgi:peptide deformylase